MGKGRFRIFLVITRELNSQPAKDLLFSVLASYFESESVREVLYSVSIVGLGALAGLGAAYLAYRRLLAEIRARQSAPPEDPHVQVGSIHLVVVYCRCVVIELG